jgi:micrococcal nuclease
VREGRGREAQVRLAALPLALLLTLPAQAATVLSVGDGDTLRVDDRGKRLTIRLACIDAPEMAQGPYGEQSRALLASLAPVGSDVTLKVVDTDRYGRTVAEIIRGGQNLNLRMVRRGQAFAYRQYLSNCDPTAYLRAERGAEVDRYGVWGVPGGIQRPWDFRHGRRGYRPAASRSNSPAAGPPPGERRYRCSQIGSYAQAQVLLRQGHTYLDGNGDGQACGGEDTRTSKGLPSPENRQAEVKLTARPSHAKKDLPTQIYIAFYAVLALEATRTMASF